MKWRDFITVFGGTVAAWPLASRAQKPRKWRVGFQHPWESSALVSTRIDAFRDGLGAPGGDAEIVVRSQTNSSISCLEWLSNWWIKMSKRYVPSAHQRFLPPAPPHDLFQ
jgi:hypothetical protein